MARSNVEINVELKRRASLTVIVERIPRLKVDRYSWQRPGLKPGLLWGEGTPIHVCGLGRDAQDSTDKKIPGWLEALRFWPVGVIPAPGVIALRSSSEAENPDSVFAEREEDGPFATLKNWLRSLATREISETEIKSKVKSRHVLPACERARAILISAVPIDTGADRWIPSISGRGFKWNSSVRNRRNPRFVTAPSSFRSSHTTFDRSESLSIEYLSTYLFIIIIVLFFFRLNCYVTSLSA